MNNQPTPSQPTPSQPAYSASWSPAIIVLTLLIAGLGTYEVCKVTSTTLSMLHTVFAAITVVLVVSSAVNSAYVNATIPADQPGNPVLKLLQYWLIPNLFGFALLGITIIVRILYGHNAVPTNDIIQMSFIYFFLWTAIGQLVGRICSGRPQDAVLTVVGLAVIIWASYALSSLWSTEKKVMLMVPDIITAITHREMVTDAYGQLEPFYSATLIITTTICLIISLRSYIAPKNEVITPFGGFILMTLLTTAMVAENAILYAGHLDEYPCGQEWGEWLLRQMIAAQIPLLFASMMYGLLTTSSLHTWIKSRRIALRRIWCTPLWAVIHSLIWLALVFPFHQKLKYCAQVDQIAVIMPICASLLVMTITMTYQALRLQHDTNPLFYFAIVTAILAVPILPAAETAQWPYRPILDAVLTSSMNHSIPISTIPITLAIVCACCTVTLLVSLKQCINRNVTS